MAPVLLSILLVVLMSGAALWVVASEHPQPTRTTPETGTRTQRGDAVADPAPRPAPTPALARSRPFVPPRRRHPARSGVLLVAVVVVMGVLVAVVIGALTAALAFALRAAVTS